ncbi:rhamnogalacturonan acetylesterase [Streptomyces sp. NPDC057376]|uniref:rhamnogalacturonan acetylesterase n=1 Tax=unclassified Streptomyces TaxID=2593676 RepID=UPI00093E4541|nr:rhamnogalacturonan acetylesterase [Streptomyces sp. CB02414]OKI86078.1 carbohydrate esterase [Streptomyces sp. CB02414]
MRAPFRSPRATSRLTLLAALTAATVTALALPAQARGERHAGLSGTCVGTAPVVCHFDVPPGNYDVTAVLGGATAGSTSVEAETRRAMLHETVTAPGRHVRRSFTVNVRAVEGQPTDDDIGTPGLDLRFGGSAPLLEDVKVTPARHASQILLAGDSTVCDQALAPWTGWGQRLPQSLRRGAAVANYADSGESTVSFLGNPLLFDALESRVRRGDLVLVQLAHNDKTTTAATYRANLTAMAQRVRARGGQPVFVTPMVRRLFNPEGRLTPVAQHVMAADLPAEMRSLATELDVPLIDLTAASKELVEELGPEASKDLYLTGIGDNTHTSVHGAATYAQIVADSLREQGLVPPRLFR